MANGVWYYGLKSMIARRMKFGSIHCLELEFVGVLYILSLFL